MTTPPPHPAAAAAAALPWHLAGCLVALKAGVDAHWPTRDKRSDGGIGDAAHQAEGSASDHNPWLSSDQGPAVRAYDFTASQPGVAGVDGPWLAECLRLAGAAGDPRLVGRSGDEDDNGYVIYDHHITAPDFSRWVPYDGGDPHTSHVHVSATRDPAGFEDARPWAFLQQAPQLPGGPSATPRRSSLPTLDPIAPQPAGQTVPAVGPHEGNTADEAPAPVANVNPPETDGYNPPGQDARGIGTDFRAQFGNEGPRVKDLQAQLNQDLSAYSAIPETGYYGPETSAVVQDFARRVAADPNCPANLWERLSAADGNNVGEALAAVFPQYGIYL